jgi:hypothetical protein
VSGAGSQVPPHAGRPDRASRSGGPERRVGDGSPLAPVVGALADVAASRGRRATAGVAAGLVVPVHAGWIPASAFAEPDGAPLRDLLDRVGAAYRVPPHAAVALAWKAYSYWTALPAVVGWSAHRRVLLAGPDDVVVRQSPTRPYLTVGVRRAAVAVLPGDPVAGEPGVRVVPDESALLDALRTSLVDTHLAAALAAFHRAGRVGERQLWGSVAEALTYPLAAFAPVFGRPVRAEVDTMLAGIGAPLARLVHVAPDDAEPCGFAVRRRTCCLAFTNADLGFCASCCVVPRAA